MPDVTAELKAYLTTQLGLDRIYTNVSKQAVALPYIRLDLVTTDSIEHLTGISGVARATVDVIAYDSTPDAAFTLAESIRLAPLQKYSGVMGASLQVIVVTAQFDGYDRGHEPPIEGAPAGRWFVSREYEIIYREPTQ